MRNTLASVAIGVAALGAMVGGFWVIKHATDSGSYSALDRADEHWGLLKRYCVECHNAIDWVGGIAFDVMSPEDVPTNAEIWEKAVRKLRGSAMPPPGGDRPDERSVDAFVSWLEGYLDEAAVATPRPGRVGLHRLNRREYANVVRDLLGVEIDPSAFLPQDDTSAGFDNIASSLTSTPVFVGQFVDAARKVADLALGVSDAPPVSHVYRSGSSGAGAGRGRPYEVAALPLGARDGIVVTHAFPVDGEYSITIDDIARSMSTNGAQYVNRIVVTVDGKIVYETSIGGEGDLKTIDQQQDIGVEAINRRLRNIRFAVEAGQREVAVLFARRTHAESENLLEQFSQSIGRGGSRQEVLNASAFEIRGPFEVSSASTAASREKVFSCYPNTAQDEDACAEEIVGSLTARAYRRPLAEHEMQERLSYYHAAKENGGFEAGIRMAIVGILASPHFLFRVDNPSIAFIADTSATDSAEAVFQLNDFELASRLAFFLWSSLPDEELLAVAATGQLRDSVVLERQVQRMLSDARSETLATDFAFQWLQLSKMNAVRPDAAVFPDTAGRLDPRPDFQREITLFIDSIFRDDRSVVDLLKADYTFVNETLAWRYGIKGIRGNHFRRVDLEQSIRWGLLGKGALLLASSYPNRTSPVLRGDYILHNIIGVPPAPPPPGVETNLDAVAPQESLTVRERLAVHSQSPSCNGCHGVIDPLGFALENFNVDGTWRDMDWESGKLIDASGVLPDGTGIEGPDELREALLRRPDQFVQTFVEKLLSYAVGRTIQWYDMPAVRKIVRDSAADDYRFSSVVMSIVQSVPFGMREAADADADADADAGSGETVARSSGESR